jgi:glyoxylase-like metal-dependent hydrolase (beta-lactamase superfamily II)
VAAAEPKWPAFPEDPKSHTWEKVGDGVYAVISPIGITPLVTGNSLVVIGDESVLVVDTGEFPSFARAEIAEIRRLTPLPVRYVVTTHWHPDHWIGNDEFKRAYPGVSFISTDGTRSMAQSHGAKYATADYARSFLERADKALESGVFSDGRIVPPDRRPYVEMAQVQLRTFVAELKTTTLVYPNTTFGDKLDVYLGMRRVEIRFLGRGNTGGDTVVFVPDANVLATGDLVVNPYPYGTGSFYGEWAGTLRKLVAMNAKVIVPGHGVVEHDQTYLLRLIRLLDRVQTDVKAAVTSGLTLEETQKKLTLADDKTEFCVGREFRKWCEDSFANNFIGPSIVRSYKEIKEGPLDTED